MHLHAMAGLSPAWVFVGSGRATGMRRCPATPLTRSPRRALVRPENYSQRSTTFSRARSYQCPGSLAGALGRLTRRFVPRMSITGVPRLADHLLRQQLLDNSYKAITTTPLPADRPTNEPRLALRARGALPPLASLAPPVPPAHWRNSAARLRRAGALFRRAFEFRM